MKREQKKNLEKLEKVIEEKKKIPKEIKHKINSKAFENIVIVAVIILYLSALNIGMYNIPSDIYIIGLKVFSFLLLITTIIVFELGYKRDNGEIWLHGVETMIIGIFSVYLIYLYSIFYSKYGTVILIAGIICLVYFAIKIIIIQRRIEKDYNKSLTDIGEIVKK